MVTFGGFERANRESSSVVTDYARPSPLLLRGEGRGGSLREYRKTLAELSAEPGGGAPGLSPNNNIISYLLIAR
jgi:hypothetical protein